MGKVYGQNATMVEKSIQSWWGWGLLTYTIALFLYVASSKIRRPPYGYQVNDVTVINSPQPAD